MGNFISGKTIDDRNIIMDGFRIESFLNLGQYSSSDEIIEVTFKSGQTVQEISNPDEESEDLWEKLMEAIRQNTPAPDPRRIFERFNPTNSFGWFDPSTVEFLIYWESNKKTLVELHFASGKTISILADELELENECYYPAENVVHVFWNEYRRKKASH